MERTLKVLFVDDDQMVQEIARSILGQEGDLAVEVAGSGEIALNKLDHVKYDAVITDYLMPGINGVDLIREARKKGCESIFILFTGKGSEEIATDSLVIGAEYYFLKSGDAKTDLDLIKATLRQNGPKAEVRLEQSTVAQSARDEDDRGVRSFPSYHRRVRSSNGLPRPRDKCLLREDNRHRKGERRGNQARERVERALSDLVGAFEEITRTGTDVHLEGYSPLLNKPLKVSIFSPEKGHFVAMIDDLDKERGLEEALRQANRKLNLLGSVTRQDMQDQFMAMNGFINMAHDGCDNEVIRDYLEKALRSGENIRHILEFSRDYERIGVKPPEWFMLKDTVERVLTDLKIEGIRTNIKLDGLEVLADQLLERALYHLMDNM